MSICNYLLSLLLTFCVFRNVYCSCVFQDGRYDLSLLDRSTAWPVAAPSVDDASQHYEISVCRPLNYSSSQQKGCSKSSVCLISRNNTISYGNAIEATSNYAIADNIGAGFSLYVLTNVLCKNKGIYRATINFVCGSHLGAPELILKSECQVNFYWRTSAACPVKPKKQEVPCYVLDNDGNKRDLSPLIKGTGGYYVISANPTVDFIINVCSDLSLNNSESKCPSNAFACRISGKEYVSFGSVSEGLKYTPEGLLLSYKIPDSDSFMPQDCKLKPKTMILFKCPARGYSQPPKLISDSNCQFEVEWETEYACPENALKGNFKTCQFTREAHGVEIDLSPLSKVPVYNISDQSNSTYFSLSVCGGLGNVTCGGKYWKSTAVCVYDTTSGRSQIGGTTESAELVYADNEVFLKYSKGENCNGTEQVSVINFYCDLNASNDGKGEPYYVASQNCTHIFRWPTKHVCLKNSLDTPCYVIFDKKAVNLQKLLLTEGEPWDAIDIRISGDADITGDEYFINVCGEVSKLGNLSMCGDGSAACALTASGQYINLGNFTSPPVYDNISDSVILYYSGGSPCKENKTWQSSIEFMCRPGYINSHPVLTNIDKSECRYEFEWQTAEACPAGLIQGSNCKVYDSDLGINYDLTPLKSKVYEIENDMYKFYMGICEPIKNSPCGTDKDLFQNVGVCQVVKSNQSAYITGEPSSRLSYMDGVINLTYLSGASYYDQNRTARITIIIFICQRGAGNGEPYFVDEVNFAFVFHWYTDLVCPSSASTECIVHDPYSHVIYDLSGLSMARKNWMTAINEDNRERKIYMNVCRSLTIPRVCDSKAAACLVEETSSSEEKIANLGRAVNPPVLERAGHLTLKYTGGDHCVAYGENTTFSTVIHFLCAEDTMSPTGLRYLGKVGACEYSFLWTTADACPRGDLRSNDSCQLTDPDSGFTFDLMPLYHSKQPFTVQLPSGVNFQLNICGRINDGCLNSDGSRQSKNISVCEVNADGYFVSSIAVSDYYTLSYSTGQDLSLTYKSADKKSRDVVVIKFPCYNSSEESSPKFLHHESGRYIFEMKTSLTCIPEQFDCNIVDQFGNEYDLTPLAKYNDENWEISDYRPAYPHIKYHINFCRPLNKVSSYKCHGGSSAACQTSLTDPEVLGYDLGSHMEKPTLRSKDTIVIRYTGGSFCHNGQFRRSTTIFLFCSSEEEELKMLGETPECEYLFSLYTPLACPVESSHGNNCIVKDPLFGYMFNLNPLKSKNNYYNVTVGEYVYAFNVCGKLNGFNNKCTNSSACQLKPKDPEFSKSLGLPSDVLMYRKGLITLEYKSGSGNCHGKHNRTTRITFTCHHAHEDKDGPIFIAEAQDCTYLFEWPTVHACPPFDVIECSVVDDKGVYYDLSRLSLPNENYYIKNPMSNDETFVINVCRSVVHTPDSLCPYTSAACLVDSTVAVDPLNLGRVAQAPYFENGKIKISYTTGDPCDDDHPTSARFMQTVIEFTCNPALKQSEPEFIGKDDCTYYFDWETAYACPPKNIESSSDCSVQDPMTGYLYNLSSLKDNSPFRTRTGNHQYYLNICGNSSTTPCGSDVGMCQEEIAGSKRHWVGGQLNANLTYNDGILYLNYTGGDSCHNGRFSRNTLIEFTCGKGIGEPQFLFESNECTYSFIWKTELACQTHMECVVKNGSYLYDLTALDESYHTAASVILNDDASYFISVCDSLEKIPGISCPPEAAICRVSRDPKTSEIVAESLGKVEYPPMIDFMGHATVLYTNGSTCLKNKEHVNRARIIFLCDSNVGVDEPVLLEVTDDCVYLFEWRTSVVCPEKPEVSLSFASCNYTDNNKGIHFNLQPLQMAGVKPYYQVFEGKTMTFMLNVCAGLRVPNTTKCDNTGVCARSGNVVYNYGVAESQKFIYDGQRLRLMFYDGDDCPTGMNGKRTAEIFFMCDPTAGLGYPVLHKRYTCFVVFMWKTNLVCQNMHRQCAFDLNGKHYNFNLLSSLTHNWVTTDSKNNTYWLNLCRGIQPFGDARVCSSAAAVCKMEKFGNVAMPLGTVESMQVKSLNSTDLLLTFDSGDAEACASVNSAPHLTPVTRLFMRCGTTLGQPRMFSGPDSKCFYDFVWESSLACAEIAEEVMLEKDGIIKDKRLDFSFDINDILNKTFNVSGNTLTDQYIYKINLSGGVARNTSDPRSTCAKAAICQTKPDGFFERDIGSFDTRTFILRGSELHLVFKSLTKPCGKNKTKDVTTLINMQCSSAVGYGSPTFLYESGNCDYIFEWPTIVVCPEYDRKKPSQDNGPKTDPFHDIPESSNKAEIAVGVIFGIIAAMVIVFIVIKAERRAIISSRFRSLFGRVSLPYFRYKRCDGERLVLVDAAQTLYDDDDMLRC